ncbi:MAG TPA: TadE/TadG family type IV pilus assembly protein [Phenylobacterium sp.]
MHPSANIAARPLEALRRFARAQRGATAVEFAFIATPFLLLLFGILELGLIFLVSTTLEHATQEASRKIRTGEFQSSGAVSSDDFETAICDDLAWIGSGCKAQLNVNTRAYTTIAQMAAGVIDPTKPDCFESGGPGSVMFVKATIQWKIFTPLLRPAMAKDSSGNYAIQATTAFRNEPFPGETPADACP